MPSTDQRVNHLIDELEAGKIGRSEFLGRLSGAGLLGHGIGALVGKRPGGAGPAAPQKDLLRTGLVLKISKRSGDDNKVFGHVRAGAIDLTESFTQGHREFTVMRGAGQVDVAGKAVALKAQGKFRVDHHQVMSYHNKGQAWEFEADCHPTWDPQTVTYSHGGKDVAGGQMWFELKGAPDDTAPHAYYQVLRWTPTRHDAGGGVSGAPYARYQGSLGNIALDGAGTETLTEYNDVDTRVFTAIAGSGSFFVDGKQQPFERGDSITINPKVKTKIVNKGPGSLLVEMRPTQPGFWHPDHAYWEVSGGQFATADQVWFELVMPT